MTTRAEPWGTTTPAQLRDRMLGRVEERMADALTRPRRRIPSDPHAAAMVSGLAELIDADGPHPRSAFCLTGYLAAGGDPEGSEAVDAAAALEFLDAWQMLRDDVRGNTIMRRGIPTLHVGHAAEHERNGWRGEARRFGEGTAVLAGDLALACGDRLAARLPEEAAALWDDFRTERIIGAQADAGAATEYLGDPWPGRCVTDCPSGCAAGWYALHHPLLIGASLAGRPDLAAPYEEYAGGLHAAWRLRGFLDGGPGYDADAQFLREAVFGPEGRKEAERLITEQVARTTWSIEGARLAPGWHAEFAGAALRIAGGC